MTITSRTTLFLLLVLCSLSLSGQDQRSRLVVTAASAGQNIRFSAPAGGAQMRVQISTAVGDPFFDSGWKDGNVLDWRSDSSGQPLANGSYRCVVMVRNLEGAVTQKEAALVVRDGQLSIEPREGLESPAIIQAGNGSPRIAMLAHDGQNGAVVSTGGALSFRFGDFLTGNDTEGMRLTPDGELHVSGYVRTKGLMFPDGTIVKTAAEMASTGRDSVIVTQLPGVSPAVGTLGGSKPHVRAGIKPSVFTPAYQFVVGDAGVSVGTTNPAYNLDVTGVVNTASSYSIGGARALYIDAAGNAIVGYLAGPSNAASGNAFFGTQAGQVNSTGASNSFFGYQSGASNTNGSSNAFFGMFSGVFTTANNDSFLGASAGFNNTTGASNTGVGYRALYANSTGTNNIAVGATAGISLTTGNNNIDIGNSGIAGESATIRIGANGQQTRAFIGGISGVTTAGSAIPVLIDVNGQLGTASSSRRYKFDIADMAHATAGLMALRPVTFRYLAHGDGAPLQYGLIAEEVAEIYPEMVARDEDGKPDSVLYQFLAPMLLNEVQRQHVKIEEQQTMIDALVRRLDALERRDRR